MKKGDRVKTSRGEGEVMSVGGKPPDTPHPDFPDWKQAQLVVVLVAGVKYLLPIEEIEPA